jgi:hypothetical protein
MTTSKAVDPGLDPILADLVAAHALHPIEAILRCLLREVTASVLVQLLSGFLARVEPVSEVRPEHESHPLK